jgi:hypothetical protein
MKSSGILMTFQVSGLPTRLNPPAVVSVDQGRLQLLRMDECIN